MAALSQTGDIMEQKRGGMTVREAGRMGGQKNADTHDLEHFQRIGRKGGNRTKELVRRALEMEREEQEG